MENLSEKNLSKTDDLNQTEFNQTRNAVNAEKVFFRRDIMVYCALIILIVSLFVIFLLPKGKNADGFVVSRGGTNLVTFSFNNENQIEINQEFAHLVEYAKTENGYSVKIYANSTRNGYNVIFFNFTDHTAKVTDSNCSERKDCYHTPKIKNKGSIYCSPHDLLIKPIGYKSDSSIVVG